MSIERLKIIEATLGRLSFAPSCVDMAWQWEVKRVFVEGEGNYGFAGDGFMIRTTFQRPDRDTGKVARGFGRWWHIPSDASESAVVKTAYAAAKAILEHELMESFRYEGHRIFDPHHDVDDLLAAVKHRKKKQ